MITNPEAKPYMVATLHRWLGCVCHGSMVHPEAESEAERKAS